MTNNEITFEVKMHYGVIQSYETGWRKELNLIAWNGGEPKYDIRDWSSDHERMSRGITLTEDEMRKIIELLQGRL